MLRTLAGNRCQTLFTQICYQTRAGRVNSFSTVSFEGTSKDMGRSKFRQRNRDKKEHRKWEDRKDNAEGKPTHGNDPRDQKPRGYAMAVKQNEAFENYYKGQGIVPEGEWDDFIENLRNPLPSTFRVAGFRAQARELVKYIKGQYFSSIVDLTIDGKKIDAPKCLPWYPGELAWQLNLDRGCIRKCEELKKLHQFLVSETESGNISRQEAVSMLPPLVLDIKPHHKILDMCAAPGSKTAQLIEFLHADENITIPDGFVVANDSDNKRCYLMVHQVKRLESPNFMIINHDASQLPNMRLTDDDRRNFVTYDRVLCDVPCSGDGTMRKNPDVWTKWNAAAAMNLHGLQCRILKRGLELLEVGGRLVYSTCSFNPVEDEAVVGSLLEKCEGAVELVDVTEQLPGLKHTQGLKNWKVMTRSQEWYESFSDVPEKLHTQIRPSMFPLEKELRDKYKLEHCIRVLPHHQDTGGFFVAVLEKRATLPWMKEKETEAPAAKETETPTESKDASETKESSDEATKTGEDPKTEDSATADSAQEVEKDKMEVDEEANKKRKAQEEDKNKRAKKPRLLGYKEDPFVWLSEADPVWPPIKEFFGLKEGFSANQLMVRCIEGKKRNLYYTTNAVRTLTELNAHRVKFINMGVKMFARSDSQYVKCDFRLVNDGINVVYPFIGSRVVEILPEDLVTILSQENPFLYKISDFARDNIEKLDQGGVVFICKNSGKPNTPNCDIVLTGWKGKASCRSFLRRFERSHYLRLFGHELKTKEERDAEKAASHKEEDSSKMDDDSTEVENKDTENGNGDTPTDAPSVEESGNSESEVKSEAVTDETEEKKAEKSEEQTDAKKETVEQTENKTVESTESLDKEPKKEDQ